MPTPTIAVGTVKVRNFPEEFCFETFEQFLAALQELLVVEIPASVTNVIVSNLEPSSSQRSSVWFRYDNAGSFIGIYLFTDGEWIQVLPPPNQVVWMFGDSDNLPAGFQLVDSSNPNFTGPELTHLQAFFYPPGATPPYTYFAVTYA